MRNAVITMAVEDRSCLTGRHSDICPASQAVLALRAKISSDPLDCESADQRTFIVRKRIVLFILVGLFLLFVAVELSAHFGFTLRATFPL
jgi:hypothetical protein